MKTCRICSEVKDVALFYPNRRICKLCHNSMGYLWKDAHKQQWLETVAKSKKRLYDIDSSTVLKRNTEWRKENKDWVKSYNKQYQMDNPEIVALSRRLRGASIKRQCPPWANVNIIKSVYKKARTLGLEVDHIIPLQGKLVSGLHVENNLQLLTRTENRIKSNKYECDHSFGRYQDNPHC